MNKDIIEIGRTVLAAGWGTLTSHTIEHGRRDGSRQQVVREVYDHGNGAAVLLFDPQRKTVILTRQFRFPPHLNGDPALMIEAAAGLLDGDTPEHCARREAVEETGYEPIGLHEVFSVYLSPGSLSEKCTCFVALYDRERRMSDGGGIESEGEDIEVVELSFAEALDMVRAGAIADAKTVLLLQWLALNPHWPGEVALSSR